MEPSCHLFDLPQEIILGIFQYLPNKTKIVLQSVCKYTYDVVLTGSLYNIVNLSRTGVKDRDFLRLLEKVRQPRVKNLDLRHCSGITGSIFSQYGSLLNFIQILDLSGTSIGDETFSEIWSKSSGSLKELSVLDCKNLTNRLVCLRSSHNSLSTLQLCYHLSPLVVCQLVQLTPSLQELDTGGIIVSIEHVRFILEEVECLKALCIPWSLIADDDIADNLKIFQKLCYLNLQRTDVTSYGKELLRKSVCTVDI